jgi:uncharacterized protein YbcI
VLAPTRVARLTALRRGLPAEAVTSREHKLLGGELSHAIANAVVRGHSRFVGRGPVKAHAFYRHNIIVVVMRDAQTQTEQSLVADSQQDAVFELRRQLHQVMHGPLLRAVEAITGHRVEASMSATHVNPDLAAELFVLDHSLPTAQAAGGLDAPG